MTDKELTALIGKPYSKENAKKLIYGGRVNSQGIIVEVITKQESKRLAKRCKPFAFLF